MRLQVEIAAASWIASARGQLAQDAGRAALGQREPLAQLERRGLVGDAEREQLTHRRSTSSRLGVGSASRLARCSAKLGQLAQLALDPLQFRRHDRDVDQQQSDEDE